MYSNKYVSYFLADREQEKPYKSSLKAISAQEIPFAEQFEYATRLHFIRQKQSLP